MALLYITRATREVREITNGIFPPEYYTDKYSTVAEIESKSRNKVLSEAVPLPIVPFSGDKKIPSWKNPNDGFIYRVKRLPDYEYILTEDGTGLIGAVSAFPENKEERL